MRAEPGHNLRDAFVFAGCLLLSFAILIGIPFYAFETDRLWICGVLAFLIIADPHFWKMRLPANTLPPALRHRCRHGGSMDILLFIGTVGAFPFYLAKRIEGLLYSRRKRSEPPW